MKNRVGPKKDSIKKNTLVIQTLYCVDEMKSMFIKGGLKRLSSPTCRVPALDSVWVNRPLNRLSPAKRTDPDARVTCLPCFLERDAGAVPFASRAEATPHREGGKANKSTGRRTVERLRLSDRTAQVCRARYRNS